MEDQKKADEIAPRLGRAHAVLNGKSVPPLPERPVEAAPDVPDGQPGETGGPKGPEPTRYGDWERKGRCIDF